MLCDDSEWWDEGVGGREAQEEEDKYMLIIDSCSCTMETNKHCKAIILLLKNEF